MADEKDTGFLCLTRKLHEKIVIGDNIVLTIMEVRRDSVRIGVTAPKNVPIRRDDYIEPTGS